MDLNIRFLRGKVAASDGKSLDEIDHTAVTNNFLHWILNVL